MIWAVSALLVVLFLYCLNAFTKFFITHVRRFKMVKCVAGPKALPFIGNTFEIPQNSFGFTKKFLEWTEEYAGKGERILKFWIGTKLMVIPLDGETVKAIVDSNTEIFKGSDYDFIQPWLGNGLLLSTGAKWKSRRKMLTPTFHFQMLKGYVEVFDEHSKLLTRILEPHAVDGQQFDLFPYVKRCALDIICAMGTKLNSQIHVNNEYVRTIEEFSALCFDYMFHAYNWFTPYWYACGKGFKKDRLVNKLTDFTKRIIQERAERRIHNQEMKHTRMAFLDMLLDMQETNQLTYEDIREEVDTFMFEGHDTTSSGIGWTLWCLATHPEIQKKVHEELDEHFGDSDREVTTEDLKKLKYLERCIKEAMRLFPPVPAVTRLLQDDFAIDEKLIPKGANLVICPFVIHRNNELYKNSGTFDPDNFLPERVSIRHPYDYIPFSAGPRNCIGQKFALYEEKVMIAWILRKYTLDTKHAFEANQYGIELILRPQMGFPITITARK
uniref:Cytochrome P450 n=1 Tax=Steinernema glaseri TaxID=37863 RepID=A0A1I7Y8N1_9BILA